MVDAVGGTNYRPRDWYLNTGYHVKQYLQCRLRRGDLEQTAWIPKRGAKVGKRVELLPSKEFWDVVEVFTELDEDFLRELQRMHRGSLPSIERMT